jgi:hypothetical protein
MTAGVERHFKVVGGKDVGNQPEPSPTAVMILEEALELAKRGEIQEIMLIGMTYDGVAVHGYSDVKSVYTMLGALTQATTDYQNTEILQRRPGYSDGMP